jgi:hypothetical protein
MLSSLSFIEAELTPTIVWKFVLIVYTNKARKKGGREVCPPMRKVLDEGIIKILTSNMNAPNRRYRYLFFRDALIRKLWPRFLAESQVSHCFQRDQSNTKPKPLEKYSKSYVKVAEEL